MKKAEDKNGIAGKAVRTDSVDSNSRLRRAKAAMCAQPLDVSFGLTLMVCGM